DGHFSEYKEGLLSDTLRCLLLGRDGSLWIGTASGGLDQWKPGPTRSYTVAEGLAGHSVISLAEDASGTVWIGTNRGLARIEDEKIRHQGIGGELLWSVLAGRDGSIWAGTEGAGLVRLKDGK